MRSETKRGPCLKGIRYNHIDGQLKADASRSSLAHHVLAVLPETRETPFSESDKHRVLAIHLK